jgi:hypothetical protein
MGEVGCVRGCPCYGPFMALPALLLGPDGLEGLPSEGERLVAEVDGLLRALRQEDPAEGSPRERELLLQSLQLNSQLVTVAGAAWVQRAGARAEERLTSLVEAELAEARTERKLALRLLQESARTWGRWVQAVVYDFDFPAAEEAARLPTEEDLEAVPEDALRVLRWQLDMLVAVDAISSADDTTLAIWARRALSGARHMDGLLLRSASLGMAGALAGHRARHAWDDWDDAEIDHELRAPWPSGE